MWLLLQVSGTTEEYDGTNWTNPTGLNTARFYLGGAGTQTAALAFGGDPTTGATELYDGNSWTSNPTGLNTARRHGGGAGTQTFALYAGGEVPPYTNATEEWTGAGLH
jgi:hypothetical protein